MLISGERFRAPAEYLLVVVATGLYAAGLCYLPPTVFESGDFVAVWKPTFHLLAESVRAGVVPLWNPYAGLGRPFLGDTQNVVCYPPTYLICLGQELGIFLLAWLHGAVAILGMRRLGDVLSTGRWQSYLMGFSYLASGPLIAHWVSGQIPYCWGLCYVPWLLYHAARTEEPWHGGRMAQYAGWLGLQFLCGHPQVFWFSAMGQVVFIFASTFRFPLRQSLRHVGHRLGQFGVAGVWCAGLVAVALLPMLELARESNRAESTAAFANSYNMAWTDLLSLFVPRWRGLVWESNLLVGAVIVVTGVLGLCRVRERNVRGLLGMLAIGLLLALGDNTPFFGLFYKWLPGYAGFRFQARAALLAVLALICAEGIWLSRPHPRLQALWDYLLGISVRYALVMLAVLQVLDLLQGAWMTKRFVTPTCCSTLKVPIEHSLEQRLLQVLREKTLIKDSLPPPVVCVPPSVVPANYGMVYHYASFDAACSLFLQRPWDYLHGMLCITPPIEKGSLSPQVYDHGPFPYHDVSLSVGKPPKDPLFVVNGTPAPRVFVVYAAQSADYATVLNLLTNGHDISECALLERPLVEPLPQTNRLLPSPAAIRRFELNELLVDVEAKTNALLVVGEAWYPGWRAEIDGKPGACLAANAWMRAVPLLTGRHQVRLYFRQDYLLAGLLISVASLGLLIAAVAGQRDATPFPAGEPGVIRVPRQQQATKRTSHPRSKALAHGQKSPPAYRRVLRALALGGLVACAGLLAYAESRNVRLFRANKASVDADVELRTGDALFKQHRAAEARPHFMDALRLAKEACRLTEYRDPWQYSMLAVAYYDLLAAYYAGGSLDEAWDTAKAGRDVALATGQQPWVNMFQKQMDEIAARKARPDGPK
jgi:hypothetical protein